MIQINHKDSRSLHIQIEDGIKDLIVNKVLAENQQLPSVRELSIELTVNPNTVQRAYRELEQSGFIYSIRGKGNFVSPVQDVADEKKISELYASFESVVKSLFFLGEDEEKIISFIKNIKEESK